MSFQFSSPMWLWALVAVVPWVVWLTIKSDAPMDAWRKWVAMGLRMIIVLAVVFALAGLQWKKKVEGMNVFFLMDRSESIPSEKQQTEQSWVNHVCGTMEQSDKAGVLVFGSDAAIESSPQTKVDVQKIQAVINPQRTDISAAVRLAAAAFPETGQKRVVILSDGNENVGDAMAAIGSAPGVSVDVVPQGVERGQDISIRKLVVPSTVKNGQTFDVKIFVQSDSAHAATLRLFRNDEYLGEQQVEVSAGKNLFSFPQTLDRPDFYSYKAEISAPKQYDSVIENNRAVAYTRVWGKPRILVLSSNPDHDKTLADALKTGNYDVINSGLDHFPTTLAEMESYDEIFLCNISAGDMGMDAMRLMESAVRDFGVGLICVGGDQSYAAGSYRGTPLESVLPVDMDLSSKKVLPKGAMAIVCHATEFPNGNMWARNIAYAALDALGPQDEMGIVLWDGHERWLFDLQAVGDKSMMGGLIGNMNPGDMPAFEGPMVKAYEALKKSTANIKHMIVFSDGDPSPPSSTLLNNIVADKITISTVMIGGHVTPDNMVKMADEGNGHFYDVRSPEELPQIFIKEAAVILKSAITEGAFTPTVQTSTELIKGIDAYPQLLGYVCTNPKGRAEVPLLTGKGDPLLAHWQYGLGRSVAFTSDASAKWAAQWMGWAHYRQFWSQVAQWSLRRIDVSDFVTEISSENGEGRVSVEAVDSQGNYRNFLDLQTLIISPKGDKQQIHLEQTGPGHYEAKFPTKEVGSYMLNLMHMDGGQLRGSQPLGLSINHSPEFDDPEPNINLLRRLAESTGGKILDPTTESPFRHDRQKTFQPFDLWEWLLKLAVILFTLDVAIRRIQIGREEWGRFLAWSRQTFFFWKPEPRPVEADASLSALLNRREQVRSTQTAPAIAPDPSLFQPAQPATAPEPTQETASSQSGSPPPPDDPVSPATPSKTASKPPSSTASRLLDAKRRARKRME